MQKNSGAAIEPISEAGTRKDKEEYARLSEIIKLLNERFGIDFTEADKLFFDQIEEEMVMDEKLRNMTKPIGVSEYKLSRIIPEKLRKVLPSAKEIESELSDK